jgi:hypothetical protein
VRVNGWWVQLDLCELDLRVGMPKGDLIH